MDNAQNIEDWGIQQMTVANTRIPYASTLTQLDAEGPAPNGIATEAGHLGGPALPISFFRRAVLCQDNKSLAATS